MSLVFCFAVGASIGSFLNVVVYRMPLGINLAYPPSRCPACMTPIRPWNNLPIVSWLVLRGRCAACKAPFSSRYFIVELFTALLFAALFWIELRSEGANLPQLRSETDQDWLPWSFNYLLVGTYVYHAVLLSYLLAVTLICFDRQKVPLRLHLYGSLLGLLPLLVWPRLHPVPFSTDYIAWTPGSHGLLEAGCGLLGGGIVGVLLRLKSSAGAVVPSAMIMGLFLGWQAALSVGVLASLGLLVVAAAQRSVAALRRLPAMACVSVAAVLQIVLWSALTEERNWPGPLASSRVFVLSLLAIAVCSSTAHLLRRNEPIA